MEKLNQQLNIIFKIVAMLGVVTLTTFAILYYINSLHTVSTKVLNESQQTTKLDSVINWQPSLYQPIREFNSLLDKEQTNMGQIAYRTCLSDLYDLQLYLLFYKYVASVQKKERESIIQKQSEWLQYRQKKYRQIAEEWEGGSGYGNVVAAAFISITLQKIDSLQMLISSSQNDVRNNSF